MLISFGAVTDLGCQRAENQDALIVDGWIGHAPRLAREGRARARSGSPWAAAVIDGMGGYAGGATAALLVADHLATSLRARDSRDTSETWATAYRQASGRVGDVANAAPTLSQMGATVAAIVVDNDNVAVTNVGDVRVYRWWRGYFTQLSEDDRLPGSNSVTQALGAPLRGDPEPHLLHVPIPDPTRMLVCSDGLWDVADDQSVRVIIETQAEPMTVAEALVETARSAGGSDNISVVVVDLFPEPEPEQAGPGQVAPGRGETGVAR